MFFLAVAHAVARGLLLELLLRGPLVNRDPPPRSYVQTNCFTINSVNMSSASKVQPLKKTFRAQRCPELQRLSNDV